jgi:hypothetical protein
VKLTRSSPHNQIQGAKSLSDSFTQVFHAQLVASFSIDEPDEALQETFDRALSEFVDEGGWESRLPPELMLDFMQHNLAMVLDHMADAQERIASRCVEMLGVANPTISDADLTALLDEGKGGRTT